MKKIKETNEMEIEKIPKLLLKFSLPAIIGLIVNAMYNIVDSMFVGRGIGNLGLAGVTVSLPVVTIYMACIMLIGMGATSLISIRLGEKKGDDAEKIVGNACVLFLMIGLSLSAIGIVLLKPILVFFGASPAVLPYALDYMRIILAGSVFFAIGTGMNNFIRAEGNPKIAMNTMLIATFLFWHVDDNNVTWDTYFCNFLTSVTFDNRKQADSVNYELTDIDVNTTDTAILDGQQRLTSLYLSLFGDSYIREKYARRNTVGGTVTKLLIELNKNKLDVDEEEYNSKKYDIKFSVKVGRLSPTQFELRNILQEKFQNNSTRDKAIEDAIANVPPDSKDYARNLLKTLYHKIFTEKLIRFTEIHDMNQDDALEMFVRFNSGGKALRKSEITMSILEAYWPSAKTEFGKLLVDSYEGYGSDFIIRAALMLYGDVVKSNINRKISEELKNNWSSFKKALKNLETMLKSLRIEVSRFSSSWNVLLPVLYYIYYNPENHVNNTEAIRAYLMRAILFTYFQSGTTSKLQQMKSNINSYDYEITVEMLDQITDLRVTDGKIEDILNAEKGSRVAGDALYYLCLEWTNKNFKYEQDHLHPYDRFDGNKPISVSMEDWRRWRGLRNRLPNLQLLEGRSNGSKNNMRLIDYYNDMNDAQKADFYKQAIIPEGVSLEIEHFEELYNKRKEMLAARIKALLG